MSLVASTVPSDFILKDVQKVGSETILIGVCADYDAYCNLPTILLWEKNKYGLTGWNSDSCTACWKQTRLIATKAG